MTAVAFHLPVADKPGYTCRLIRKAVGKGVRLMVTGEDQALKQLDLDLWTFSAVDFVPHCGLDAPQRIQQRSPVSLSSDVSGVADVTVLVNLGPEMPRGFEAFDRVIEVVAPDDEELRLARLRWKRYQGAGFEPVKFDLQAGSP